jgi:hypothetical protein
VKLLAQASSRALQLLLKATSKEKSKPVLLRSCLQAQLLLPWFLRAWYCCFSAAQVAAAWVRLALQQLQETSEDLLR